ncbi:Glycosyltransferase involved in cell wall bisynthesis [Pseudovibrio denitrificans]|uniref:Glycosyltransferase involved in cell wall bisynthesis n=2 Tax=Pseudovibrio TaxID=258255 RepID=A0A1I7D196_9HYPH|nr:glycosyltransferase family 2 protein [Pseudovibrio denitrificans]SFU05432.1 Glycosyltransferase involved in cell wall bisynthesis [Pseudovibrio denitrificans]
MAPQMSQELPPISILIRSFNEADRIGRTLESVKELGQEIIVIDSGSTDDTVAIAESHGAKVVYNPWHGFGPQRSFGETQCNFDWVFYIDADEVVTPELKQELTEMFAKDEPEFACYLVRNTMVLPGDKKPRLFADFRKVPRLYNLKHARIKLDPSYDRMQLDEGYKMGTLRNRQYHYSFRTWAHALNKLNYTSELAAETQKKKPVWLLRLRLVTELPVEMLKYLFVRRFIFAGWKGFAFAATQSFSRFSRILKMLEKQQNVQH